MSDNLFSNYVAEYQDGLVDITLTARFHDLVKAVRSTRKAGSLAVRLDVKPHNPNGDGDNVIISAKIIEKKPDREIEPEVYVSYGDGTVAPIRERDDDDSDRSRNDL